MNLSQHFEEAKLELQIAPLIDVVFLLLIYFMVTASLIKKEADISFMLPANVPPDQVVTLPVEVLIMIKSSGVVELDGINYSVNDRNLNGLVTQVMGLKALADSQGSPFFVNLLPSKEALHWRIIDVMDACGAAKIKSLTFSKAM